jgi:thioredoxin-dependent peroxiredoxin
MLKVGDQVPDFAFSSETFGSVSADSLRGKRYVMYFYPKDDTPGCTREACAFRDNLPRFGGLGIKVFGISADDEKSHLRFARKHSLNFKLIPDPDHVICEAFGTWVEKSMYGRSYMGVARNTYVIGPEGKIEKIWEKVAPDGHAEEVFAWLNGDPIPVPVKAAPTPKPVAAKPLAAAKPVGAAQPAAKPVSIPAPKPVAAAKPVPVAAAKVVKPTKTASLKSVATPAKPVVVSAGKAAGTKPATKPVASKPAAKKPVAAKPVAKKAPVKKPTKAKANKPVKKPARGKPVAAKKPVLKKVAPRKAAAKKPIVKKPAARKSAAKPKRR